MIAVLDSALPADRPTAAMIPLLSAAGIRVWGGYIATRPGVNLLSPWDLASFDVVRQLGSTPIAFCSGLDDPVALRALAGSWNVRLGLDVESGIRGDGPWVQPFLDASGAGLYGNLPVHAGRNAAFHVLASYPCPPPQLCDPGATWGPVGRPPGPVGWQWAGTHTEFGLSVDRAWYDDSFAGPDLNSNLSAGESNMVIIPAPASVSAGRLDVFLINASRDVAYAFSDGGAGGLDGLPATAGAIIPGTPPGGFRDGSLSACWDNLQRRVVVAGDHSGNAYMAVVNLDGSLAQGWTRLALTVALPEPGPQGPPGPPGPDAALRAALKTAVTTLPT